MNYSKLPWITILGILQLLILSLVAMFFYTGGTLNDPHSLGYSFCLNKFSDLGMSISYSGKSNWISFWIFNPSLTLFGASIQYSPILPILLLFSTKNRCLCITFEFSYSKYWALIQLKKRDNILKNFEKVIDN